MVAGICVQTNRSSSSLEHWWIAPDEALDRASDLATDRKILVEIMSFTRSSIFQRRVSLGLLKATCAIERAVIRI